MASTSRQASACDSSLTTKVSSSAGADHVAHVVVPVFGLGSARRNAVAVEVEDAALHGQPGHAGLLARLAQRHARQVHVAVGMPAGLQPAVQLAVMGQQRAPAVGADQPARGGEMPGQARALEGMAAFAGQIQEQRGGIGDASGTTEVAQGPAQVVEMAVGHSAGGSRKSVSLPRSPRDGKPDVHD